jgi:hypothetical protein
LFIEEGMLVVSYEVEHEKWLKRHLSRRKGKSLEALKRGHGYGNQKFTEYIWWRLFGHFKDLHPEFEILDWRGFPFYADFVWIVGSLRIVFEIQTIALMCRTWIVQDTAES